MAERKTGSSKQGSDKPKKDSTAGKKDSPAAKKDAAAKSSSAKPPSATKKGPAPNMNERMEGVQGWMAEIEKKQQRNSRVGGIAVILAILAAAGALVLGVLNKQDAASDSDVEQLTEKVNELGSSVEQQTEKQLQGIDQRLTVLEQQIESLSTRQLQTETQITELETQVAAAADSAAKQKP